jgi:hypothetical protein
MFNSEILLRRNDLLCLKKNKFQGCGFRLNVQNDS